MKLSRLSRRFRMLLAVAAVLVLVLGLALIGLVQLLRPSTPNAIAPNTADAVRELGRRFQVAGNKRLQLQLGFALAGGKDMQQALRDTALALQRSNAADDLTAPPVPTGDALFDRYALAIDGRLNAANQPRSSSASTSKTAATLAALSDTELAQWESEFGKDPRYWELRYLCATGDKAHAPLAAGFSTPGDFLDEAQRRGSATANTLLVRYVELREAHAAEFKPFEPKRQPPGAGGSGASPAPPAPLDPQAAAIIARQHVEQLALLDAAVAAGPDMAWARYTRALVWFEHGEQDKGLEDLAAGNAASVLDRPAPWPLKYIADAPAQATPPGSAAVCGEIYVLGLSYSQYPALRIKKALRGTLAQIKPGDDLSPLETWHQFICRFAQGSVLNMHSASTMDGILCKHVEEQFLGALTPEQLDTLQRCRGARTAFQVSSRSAQIYDWPNSSIALIPFAGYRAISIATYLDESSDYHIFHGGELGQVFADLSQVHFPELALPECMKKYEAISLEEAQRRAAERKAKNEATRAAVATTGKAQADGNGK